MLEIPWEKSNSCLTKRYPFWVFTCPTLYWRSWHFTASFALRLWLIFCVNFDVTQFISKSDKISKSDGKHCVTLFSNILSFHLSFSSVVPVMYLTPCYALIHYFFLCNCVLLLMPLHFFKHSDIAIFCLWKFDFGMFFVCHL